MTLGSSEDHLLYLQAPLLFSIGKITAWNFYSFELRCSFKSKNSQHYCYKIKVIAGALFQCFRSLSLRAMFFNQHLLCNVLFDYVIVIWTI